MLIRVDIKGLEQRILFAIREAMVAKRDINQDRCTGVGWAAVTLCLWRHCMDERKAIQMTEFPDVSLVNMRHPPVRPIFHIESNAKRKH